MFAAGSKVRVHVAPEVSDEIIEGVYVGIEAIAPEVHMLALMDHETKKTATKFNIITFLNNIRYQ